MSESNDTMSHHPPPVEFRDVGSGCRCWINGYPAKGFVQLVAETPPDKRHIVITIGSKDVEAVAAVFRRFQEATRPEPHSVAESEDAELR
ncbi:MAG TPA: hypothetical protein VK797_23415 [Tepidisphaeraceae bacterium]|jgi:hypothetical protein|nr:hypothetical protein [Tepidisphaeraceae bacterium]